MARSNEENAAHSRLWRKQHPQQLAITNHTYREAHREEIAAYKHAWYLAHKQEKATYMIVYRASHRDYIRAYQLALAIRLRSKLAIYKCAWARAHPQEKAASQRKRRALKYGATIGPIDIEAIKARDKMRCCICGRKVNARDFSLDHTIPLSLGGAHSQNNLRVAHRRCNSRRNIGYLPVQMILV